MGKNPARSAFFPRQRGTDSSGCSPIKYLERERAMRFFAGISGSDLSNGKDRICRRSSGKKPLLAEKLEKQEQRKKKKRRMARAEKPERVAMRAAMHARALSSVKRTERKKNQMAELQPRKFEGTQPDKRETLDGIRDRLRTTRSVVTFRLVSVRFDSSRFLECSRMQGIATFGPLGASRS